MKTNKYRRIATLLAFFMASIFSVSYAQTVEFEEDENIRSVIEHIFEHLDKDRVPTGFLRDYATDIVDLSQYDGVQFVDSNYVSAEILNCILRSIRSANVTAASPFPKVSSIFENYSAPAGNIREIKSTNICLAAFQYNYLPEDAVTGGKIDYTDGQVHDKYASDGSWINPYDSAYLLAFSPFENYLPTGNVTFRFPSECILSNLNISSIEFDSGTGNGFTTVRPGGSVTARYYDESIYDLAIRVTLKDGQVLAAHSKISAVDCPTPIYAANNDPLESEHEFSYGSKPIKAKVTLIRRVLDSVTRPFILVNGFNPKEAYIDNDTSKGSITSKYKVAIGMNSLYPNLFSYTADKDLVCVDWENCEASIEENGELLIQIINWVNSIKTGDEPNVVLGESMGGLVARYALRTMEISGTQHQTAMYISYDSPHQGVNVPIGAQYLAAYAHDFASRYKLAMKVISASPIGTINGKPLTDYLSLLDKYIYSSGTSANQMMCSHIDKSFNLDNTDHINWQNKLKKLGLPKGDAGNYITNVAYSNGSLDLYPYWNNALLEFNFTAESKWFVDLLGGKIITDLLLPFFPNAFSKIGLKTLLRLPGRYRIDVQATADSHRSKGQNNIAKFQIQFTKKLLWCIPLKIDIISYANNAPSSVIPLDNKPGSLYAYDKAPIDSALSNPGSGVPAIGKYYYSYSLVDTVMFVPTSSALDIEAIKESVYNSSSYYYNTGVKESPFNYCHVAGRYGPNAHVDIDDSFYSKLISISNNADIEIVGDEHPCNGSTYSLSAYVKGPVTWSVDKEWARIDSKGVVSKVGQYGGTLTISASWTEDGVTYTKSKTVFLGIPKYTLQNKLSLLSNQTTNIEIHDVLVSAVSSDVYFMKNAKEVRYEWGYRLATSNSITWEESSSNSFSMASGGVFVYIYLKVKLKNFTSETYSMRFVPTPKPTGPIELQSNGSSNNISSCANNNNVPVIYLIVNDNGNIVVTDDSGKIISEEDTRSIISTQKVREELNKVKPYGESAYSQCTIRIKGEDHMVRVINKNF